MATKQPKFPEIKLKGVKYYAKSPTMIAYRKLLQMLEKMTGATMQNVMAGDMANVDLGELFSVSNIQYEESLEFMALAFNHPEITPDRIEAELEIVDYRPTMTAVTEWIMQTVQNGASKVPN